MSVAILVEGNCNASKAIKIYWTGPIPVGAVQFAVDKNMIGGTLKLIDGPTC